MNQYAYQYIPVHLRKMYQDISLALENGNNAVTVSYTHTMPEILGVLSRCLLDNPHIFWLRSGVSLKHSLFEKMIQIVDIEVNLSRIRQMQDELERKVNSILSMNELVSCRTDSERLKFIYKYIQENTEYDYNEVNGHSNPLAHTAYGSLISGLSVCSGNTKGVMLLCQRLGIACMGVDGQMNGGDHSWLIVQSDGVWYNMDPTFRHTLNGVQEFSHWLESDNEISGKHVWDRKAYPICNMENPDAHKERFTTIKSTTCLTPTSSSIALSPKPSRVSRQLNLYPDAVHVESLSVYQRMLRESLMSPKGELKMVFDMGFGPVRDEMLVKLFEKIACDCIETAFNYSWEFDKGNRYFAIRWE